MSDKKIQWHPGFAAAMDLELSANRKDLMQEKCWNPRSFLWKRQERAFPDYL